MNYSIKKSFKASDLQVGDLMYDALNDVLVRVAFVSETIQKKVTELKIESGLDFLLSSTKTTDIQLKQFVLENTEDKTIFMVDAIGKEGKLPVLENNKPRFRHLMRFEEVAPIINWPSCPNCPSYPWPNYPSYPNYPYFTWNNTDGISINGTLTTNVDSTDIQFNTGDSIVSTNIKLNNESELK